MQAVWIRNKNGEQLLVHGELVEKYLTDGWEVFVPVAPLPKSKVQTLTQPASSARLVKLVRGPGEECLCSEDQISLWSGLGWHVPGKDVEAPAAPARGGSTKPSGGTGR